MTISVTLPSGKEILFTKGEKGVTKLFTTTAGEVVVVTGSTVTKFGNCAFICEYTKKAEAEDIVGHFRSPSEE